MDLPPYHPFRSARAKARYLAAYDVRAARWPVPCRDAWIDTSFGRTYARVSGSDDAPPLVLLPGIGATSLMWSLVVADLSQRHRVIAVDSIFDHGRSVWSRPLRSAADYVRWLDDLFDGLGLPGGIDQSAPLDMQRGQRRGDGGQPRRHPGGEQHCAQTSAGHRNPSP